LRSYTSALGIGQKFYFIHLLLTTKKIGGKEITRMKRSSTTTKKNQAQLIIPLSIFWPEVHFQVHLQHVWMTSLEWTVVQE
jgi:hypothetical protein